jgi:phosphoglycolate phosphatase
MKIKGIIFDKDGTLLDFAATWVPVLHEAASAAAGRDESRAETLLAVGGWEAELGRVKAGSLLAAGNTVEIAAAWAEHLPGRDVAELVPLLDRVFRDGGARHATPVTALGPLFQRLKSRGLALGVATSDSLAGAHASLAAFDVRSTSSQATTVATAPSRGPGWSRGFAGRPGSPLSRLRWSATICMTSKWAVGPGPVSWSGC